jgi:uncharacterized membrane protein
VLQIDLFSWWVISISWSIVFLVLVSIYLYANSKIKRNEDKGETENRIKRLGKDFVFVWVLISLLVFYIVSVNIGSSALFAAGNIIIEVILIAYLAKSKYRSDQTQQTRSQ